MNGCGDWIERGALRCGTHPPFSVPALSLSLIHSCICPAIRPQRGGGQVPLRHLPAKKGSVESGARRGVAAATGYARRDNVTTNLEPHISLVSLFSFLLSQYSYSE